MLQKKVEDPGKFTFMNEDTIKHVFEPERFYDFSVTAVAKPHKPPLYRYDVPDDVASAINTVLGQPNTEVVYVERADCEPDCGHLYHFISKNTSGDKPLYVGGTFDAKEKMIPKLSGEPLYDFISAKSFINDRFVNGDGLYPSVNDLKEISVIDQLAVYNYGLISNPSNTAYLDVYKRLDQDIMDNKPINLVYHSLDKSSYIELTVDMDLVNHRYSVKADNCLIGYGVYKDNYDMMKDFKRIHGDPLQFDKIVNVYETKDGAKSGNASTTNLTSKKRSKSLMRLIESKQQEQREREASKENSESTSGQTSITNLTNYVPSYDLNESISALIQLSGIELSKAVEIEFKQQQLVNELGPKTGFDLTKIKFHYDHRRKMRYTHECLRRGKLIYLNALEHEGK